MTSWPFYLGFRLAWLWGVGLVEGGGLASRFGARTANQDLGYALLAKPNIFCIAPACPHLGWQPHRVSVACTTGHVTTDPGPLF